jgi:hypothetical protein
MVEERFEQHECYHSLVIFPFSLVTVREQYMGDFFVSVKDNENVKILLQIRIDEVKVSFPEELNGCDHR